MEANGGLRPFREGVWLDSAPVRVLSMPLSSTMTVLRLADGNLLLHSPVAMTLERRAAVEAIGPVAHLYAPNVFHHRWIGEWAAAFPSARLHAPAGLARKRPDLRIDRVHGIALDRALADIEELPIAGFRLEESELFHRPSRTLVVADLVHKVGKPQQPWAAVYTWRMGFYNRAALSRMIRWTAFSDRIAARRSFDAVMALPFDSVVVGDGTPVVEGAREALEAAFTWLPPKASQKERPSTDGRDRPGLGE